MLKKYVKKTINKKPAYIDKNKKKLGKNIYENINKVKFDNYKTKVYSLWYDDDDFLWKENYKEWL